MRNTVGTASYVQSCRFSFYNSLSISLSTHTHTHTHTPVRCEHKHTLNVEVGPNMGTGHREHSLLDFAHWFVSLLQLQTRHVHPFILLQDLCVQKESSKCEQPPAGFHWERLPNVSVWNAVKRMKAVHLFTEIPETNVAIILMQLLRDRGSHNRHRK